MALVNSSPSSPPSVIDDDICRVIDNILKAANHPDDSDERADEEGLVYQQHRHQQQHHHHQHQPLPPEIHGRLLNDLSIAMQVERNGWKDKLQTTLQEIDRQHRASINVQCSLQDLVDTLGIVALTSPKSDSSNGRQSTDLISGLQTYIGDLQSAVNKANKDTSLQVKLKNMQTTLIQLEKEKSEQQSTIKEKTKEIHWLQKELNAIKHQLHKLRKIVLNYNESHSSMFHLDDVEPLKAASLAVDPGTLPTRGAPRGTISRERTYVEGDQLDYFSTPADEIALWKLRSKQTETDWRGRRNLRTGIAQCLRCQQLFKPNENNAMACRYHKKGREIKEQYDNTGRLSKVLYKWACCKRGLDVQGCTYGYHI